MTMWGRPLGWMVLAALLAGCGSADDSGRAGGTAIGGQTGSLVPSCGFAPAVANGEPVAAGDSAFVVYTQDCDFGLAARDVQLRDVSGQPLAIEVEALGPGVVLVRTASSLEPGSYSVVTPDIESSGTLTVVEAAPLPTNLGSIEQVDAFDCAATLSLELDDAALAHAPLIRLSIQVDGGPSETWVDYGMLEVDGRTTELTLETCDPICFSSGTHSLTVSATLAGETAPLDPIQTEFVVDCSADTPSAGGGLCSTGTAPGRRVPGTAVLLICLFVLIFAWRSARRRIVCT